ncbi:MAG: hypothetical protein E6K74_05045 [Candidatus Eisenbacteria bacterium]|uniref:Nuclear transport factor 2 family protein n=1 Tax=Eiseniibacteriota bacterium TaxID=2212470 RepID=A0A538STR4_UNCEI|nr:MAG: hypothetical protein E6K74_05045 [Candidatus Eisenbacteria bacterium]
MKALTFLLLLAGLASSALAAGTSEAPPSTAADPRSELGPLTAVRLFADVEGAWAASDAERLASLVDTTAVRIAVKPGAPLTAALTRVAAAFLLQDQLRLVRTLSFQMTRFQLDPKRRLCRGTATWTGDWGGRQGKRAVRVALVARASNNRWFLTEIRAED